MTNKQPQQNTEDICMALEKCISRLNYLRTKNDSVNGVHSGFKDLDRVTCGWQPGDLIVIAAEPCVGKTAFALNLACNAAMHPVKPVAVGIFSLAMSASQLVQRMLSLVSEVLFEKISRGKIEEVEYLQLMHSKDVNRLAAAPLFINDTGALNVFELKAAAKNWVHTQNVGLIIVDNLQLINHTSNNSEKQIGIITQHLKELAKELNIPIMLLLQLNRSKGKYKGMPQLNDLRKHGAIEQHADTVIFIYRPEYYEINENKNGESTRGETHICIAKHRNGYLDTIRLRAKLEIQKFYDCEEHHWF